MVNIENPNNKIVKSFFKEYQDQYKLLEESSHGPYWKIKFGRDLIEIIVSGDIGFSVEVFIDGAKYNLSQYDRSVVAKMSTTEGNILYQLGILNKFLNEL